MDRALRETCQRLDYARRAVDEALVRAEQLGFGSLVNATADCAVALESARAIAEGCSPQPLGPDQPVLF